MIGKICLVVLLACVLSEASPLLTRDRRAYSESGLSNELYSVGRKIGKFFDNSMDKAVEALDEGVDAIRNVLPKKETYADKIYNKASGFLDDLLE